MTVNHRYLNSYVIVLYTATGITSEIFSLYNCIALDLPTQMFIFSLWTAMVNASTFIFAYGCLADLFEAALESRGHILRNNGLIKNKWFRRFVRSCSVLKVSMGPGSFLEPVTPLVTQRLVWDQTVSLLLMGK